MAAITDRVVRLPGATPTIGAAGSTFFDPAFGSKMARATDANFTVAFGNSAGSSFVTPSSSYQQAWNSSGTKFYVIGDGGAHYVVSFNRSTMATAKYGTSALPFSGEPAMWDSVNPNVIYGKGYGNNHTIVKVDLTVLPWTATVFLDLDTITAGLDTTYIGAMTEGNGVISCIYGGVGGEYHYYVLYYPIANPGAVKVLNTRTRNGMDDLNSKFAIHSAQIDKSGRYVVIAPTAATVYGLTPVQNTTFVWDTQEDVVRYARGLGNGGHESCGYGQRANCYGDLINTDPWDGVQLVFTPDLHAPLSNRVNLITTQLPHDALAADHSSWNNAKPDSQQPVFREIYRVGDSPGNPTNTCPFTWLDQEIVSVGTTLTSQLTNNNTVWRHCHHRSLYTITTEAGTDFFYYTPRVNVDCQGEFAMFSSNWDKTLGAFPGQGIFRSDVFIVDCRPAPGRKHRRGRRFA